MDEKKTNGLAIASLVLGIVSILFCFMGLAVPFGLIIGIVGIVLGVKSKKAAPSGMATAGFVLSIIGTVICALFLFIFVILVGIGISLFV